MKKRILVLVMSIAAFSGINAQEVWPDGSPMDSWFTSPEFNVPASETVRFVITDYGVKADSPEIQTKVIQTVIDKAAEKGGTVVIPAGTFNTASLFFKQGTHLYLEKGALLKGSDDISDYPVINTRLEGQNIKYIAALINAIGVDGFSIKGEGTIRNCRVDCPIYKDVVENPEEYELTDIVLENNKVGRTTAKSLFWRSDSLEINEIISKDPIQYTRVGHHGPAVENTHSAFRVYFNDSGAIDVYSKSGKQMELLKYLWYPTEKQMAEEGAGCDEYLVGSTVGIGGIALWDGEKEIKLVATNGRTARAGETMEGSFAEIVSYGVPYKGDKVDISVRVDVFEGSRSAKVTATELSGKEVQFLTGVNYHPGEALKYGKKYVAVWGVHPSDVSQNPIPLGAGLKFDPKIFSPVEKTADMLRIISKPASTISTTVEAASTKEKELGTKARFFSYMAK